ncbi:MAG: nucleotidyltransferase domain-containing protein [Aquimonas sp.]|nr:nucleotidyltransferase domain-containing protein [Aquimonas sp.]
MNRIDHATEEAIRRFLALLGGRYSVAGAIVYGSRARGTHRPDSDADVAVLMNGERQRVLTTTLVMADAAYDVQLDTGINISPLPVWLDEWEHPETYANSALLHNIAKEGFTGPPIAAASVPDPHR